ncbi:MAG: EpsG family protein [Clostridia bacterium]|nr:EpsG family protein [Clostridia bacterium]
MSRIFLFTTILIPPTGLPLGLYGLFKNPAQWRKYVFCLALALASFAYCYIPLGAPDLVRYFQFVEETTRMSFQEVLKYGIRGESNLYIFSIVMWVIGKIGDPHLLPAISTFLVYYIGFYVTCKVGIDMECSGKPIAWYVIFLMMALNYYSIINNVRNVLAFCLIGFAIFRDCYQKKRNVWTYILYIIPLFLHQSAISILLLRLAVQLTKKLKIVAIICVVMLKPLLGLMFPIAQGMSQSNVIISLIKNLLIKSYRYFYDTDSEWGLIVQESGSYQLLKLIYIFAAVVVCMMAYVLSKKLFNRNMEIPSDVCDGNQGLFGKYLDFVFCLGLLTISCAPMLAPEYWRFASVMLCFSGILYFWGTKISPPRTATHYLSHCIFLIAPIGLMLWVREMQKSELYELLVHPFFSSPIIIVIRDLAGLIF